MVNRHSVDWYYGYYPGVPLVSPLSAASLCGPRVSISASGCPRYCAIWVPIMAGSFLDHVPGEDF
jgi:hypothetical protein